MSLDTSCAKCVFAIYDSDKKQVGCKVGRLEIFADQGVELDIANNEDGQNYIIKNRICLMCCPQETVDKLGLKNPAKEMRKRIALKCAIYILVEDKHTFEDITTTIHSLLKQKHLPYLINPILNTDNINRAKLVKYLNDIKNKDILWNITHIHDKDEKGDRPSVEWCLDHTIAKCTLPWYGVFTAGFKVPEDYISNIDKYINDDLKQVSAIKPIDDDWNGAFVYTALHNSQIYKGNLPMIIEEYEDGALIANSIIDKIENEANKTDMKHMIKKIEDICHSIKQK